MHPGLPVDACALLRRDSMRNQPSESVFLIFFTTPNIKFNYTLLTIEKNYIYLKVITRLSIYDLNLVLFIFKGFAPRSDWRFHASDFRIHP